MNKKVAIVGAGIAGLSAGHFLKKKGYEVTIFEASGKVGGYMHSQQIDGFTLEHGPNTVLLNTKGLRELILSVGLWDKIKFSNPGAGKNRFLVKDNNLIRLPSNPLEFLSTPLLTFRDKLKLLKEPFISPFKATDNPSVAAFAKRRFGPNFHYHFIEPFVTGIYAGNTEKIAVKHGLKLLWGAEQKHSSVLKGLIKRNKEVQNQDNNFKKDIPKNKLFSFEGGLGKLCEVIASQLNIKLNTKPTKAELEEFDHVIYTIKAKGLNQYTDNTFLKTQLSNIPYASVGIMHLGFEEAQIPNLPDGYGALTLMDGPQHFLGLIFSSKIFTHVAPKGKILLTAIIGGLKNPALIEDPKIRQKIMEDLRAILNVSGEPCFYKYTIEKEAIPQYHMNHQDLLDEVLKFEQANPKYHILSNFVRGISVGDCVEKAYQLSLEI